MKICYTNHRNIPLPIARAVEIINGKYDRGECDFTTTELTGPPRIRALRKKADLDDLTLEVDVEDLIYAMTGSATHLILEELAKEDERYLAEQRFYTNFDGHVISGQIDLFDHKTGKLTDWKQTKSTTYRDGVKPEYVQQLNINAWLMRRGGYEVKALASGVIYRDFSKLTRGMKGPRLNAEEHPVALWSDEDVESFVARRINLHLDAEKTLPECTHDERWGSREVWAVQSKETKHAIRYGLCSTQEEAEQKKRAHKKSSTLEVVFRPAKYPRCEHYCGMAGLCEQWKHTPTNPNYQEPDLFL